MKIGLIDSGRGGLAVAKALNASGHSFVVVMDEAFFLTETRVKIFMCQGFLFGTVFNKTECRYDFIGLQYAFAFGFAVFKGKYVFSDRRDFSIFGRNHPSRRCRPFRIGRNMPLAKQRYPDLTVMDGGDLIAAIQYQKNIAEELKKINEQLKSYGCVLLACTHFLMLDEKDFCIPVISPISFVKKALLQKEKELRLGSS